MLRDDEQATLQALERQGRELAERYRSLTGSARERLGEQRLDRIARERERLLEDVAGRIRAHGELPMDGERDRAHLESLSDRVLAGAGADETLAARLSRAERDYRDELERALAGGDWDHADRECLQGLRDQADQAAREWEAMG
jgi:hypothetical protein